MYITNTINLSWKFQHNFTENYILWPWKRQWQAVILANVKPDKLTIWMPDFCNEFHFRRPKGIIFWESEMSFIFNRGGGRGGWILASGRRLAQWSGSRSSSPSSRVPRLRSLPGGFFEGGRRALTGCHLRGEAGRWTRTGIPAMDGPAVLAPETTTEKRVYWELWGCNFVMGLVPLRHFLSAKGTHAPGINPTGLPSSVDFLKNLYII